MESKIEVSGHLRVRVYDVLVRAVEEGFQRGWNRAHKHTDTPTDELIAEQVTSAILGDICEVFDFEADK